MNYDEYTDEYQKYIKKEVVHRMTLIIVLLLIGMIPSLFRMLLSVDEYLD